MHDFIAIGDTVTDAFIKLKEATVTGVQDKPDYKICLPFANKVPYESVEVIPAVGNATNAAVSSVRLGLKTALVTNLGDDDNGRTCLDKLTKEALDIQFVKVNTGLKTNYHYVLWYESDRTILTKHESFSYVLPELGAPKWIYFSSVAAEAYPFHDSIADYLEKHTEVSFAFGPGKNEIKLGTEKLQRLYKRAQIFFCNVDEAEKIINNYNLDIKTLLKQMKELGPEIVVITEGPKGAHAYDGTSMWFQPPYPDPKPPYERTGAGDAFASTCVAALALGFDLEKAMQWGAINSMSVVQEVGAQKGLLTRAQLEAYLKSAPADFQTKKLD